MTANYTLGPHSCRPFWARWPQRTLRREKASFPHFLQELSTFSRVYFDSWFFFFYHSLASSCMQLVALISAQTHTLHHLCFLCYLLLLALTFNFSLLPVCSLCRLRCSAHVNAASKLQFFREPSSTTPHTNLIFFPISSLLLCQHFLIVPSAGSFGSAVTCVFCPCVSALMYWLFSGDAQVVVPARQYWPLCGSTPLLQVYEW